MSVRARLGALLLAGLMPAVAGASPLVAEYADPVQSTPELTAFLRTVVAAAGEGIGIRTEAYSVLDDMIAPKIRGFTRGLDPFEPWAEIDLDEPDRGSGVELLTSWMVEQGDIVVGASDLPDYRQDLLELLVRLIADPDEPLGRMPGMGEAVCSPARYGFNSDDALAFAQAHDADGSAIRFYPRELSLRESPDIDTPTLAVAAPRTLLVSVDAVDQGEGWLKVVMSDGTTGWTEDQGDYRRLSQQHLCFAEVDGRYMITGFYSYGL